MVSQIQFTNPQAYSGGVDFSPLERLGYALSAQQKEAQQSEEAYRLMGGQGQPQGGGFFQDLGRRFGLIPEAAPGAPPARATAPVPTSPQVADGSGIGTMTPNAKSWFNYSIRPVAEGGLGLSQAQAAGKVANLQAESTPNITPWGETGDQGTAHGAAQWREGRLRNLVEFSRAKGLDYKTTEAQQAFMRHEYLGNDPQLGNSYGGGSEGKAYAALSATNSPQAAATAVNRYYERSADKSGRREAGAAKFAGAPVVAQGGPNASFQATPRLPAGLSPPPDPNASPLDNAPWPQGNVGAPVMAQGADPTAPSPPGVAPPLAERAVPAAPVVASDAPEAKVAQNLVSGQPAAAAGVNREQLAQMYRNPITRPLATAILQKQMDPNKWSYQQIGDRLVALNRDDPTQTKVIMEDTKPLVVGGALATRDASQPSGWKFNVPPSTAPIHVKEGETVIIPDGLGGSRTIGATDTKAQREIEGNTYKADVLGLTGRKREFMIANGKVPSSEDIPAGDRRRIDKLSDAITAADSAITTLGEMETLNQQAFKGWGANFKAAAAANLIPNTEWGKRGQATLELNNEMTRSALNQLKATFTGSQSKEELAVLRMVQGAIDNPGTMNANIFKRARDILELRRQRSEAEQESIATGEKYKPGGSRTVPPPKPEPEPAAATGAKPSLNDFMVKARAANPGVSEGELARYWKQKYGG